jgi:hypothetical protein
VVELSFAFPFFAGMYTAAAVNENGYITFGETATYYENPVCPFDNKATHQNIAAMWTDLLANSELGQIHWAEFAACPIAPWTAYKCAVVQWTDVPYYDKPTKSSGTWQIVLVQNGDIALQYDAVAADELRYTTGIKSSAGGTWTYILFACKPTDAGADRVAADTRIVFTWDPLKTCNNSVCDPGENCMTCPRDCPAPCGLCGDGTCSSTESCQTCTQDCGACCGDGVCSAAMGEHCGNCPSDCASPCCGDGVCGVGETSCSCPKDCNATACCGDNVCSTAKGESCLTCIADCAPRCAAGSLYTVSIGTDWLADVPASGSLAAVNGSASVVGLPFSFPYFERHFFSRITIGSKGALWFGADASSQPAQQCPLTNSGMQYLLAPFFADLYFAAGSSVRFANISDCPTVSKTCFAVQYDDMAIKGTTSRARFQVVLYSDGSISFNYDLLPPAVSRVTVGIKGVIEYGTSWGYNLEYCDGRGSAPVAGMSLLFTYTGCGDTVCSSAAGETCATCPRDCPAPCGICGDGTCDGNETCQNCSPDCGKEGMDTDGDHVFDCADGCPFDAGKTSLGVCGCGKPDKDTDKDGVMDCIDVCPTNPSKTVSVGVCGCQMADIDTDGDGVLDCKDACPGDPKKNRTVGYCGCGNLETDTDGDNLPDCVDGCPTDPDKTVVGLCGCFTPETDDDKDGWPNCIDECPNSTKGSPGACGCYTLDVDTDGDQIADCIDPCPTMYNVTPTVCGCGQPVGGDSDGDGVPDCADRCPHDPKKADPGYCGCGNLETDTDGDGIPDCKDGCPMNPAKKAAGYCGCSVAETDTDGDQIPDCVDKCPSDPFIQFNASDRDGDQIPDCTDQCPDDPTKSHDSDTDGDKLVDCVDGCPLDGKKAQPLFCGCGAVDPASTEGLVQSPMGLTMTTQKRDITCSGLKDGYVAATASGGTGVYTYKLSCTPTTGSSQSAVLIKESTVGNSVRFTNQTEGICTLHMADTNGCSILWPQLFAFTVPSVMRITTEQADEGACQSSASLLVAVTGGLSPH